MDTEPSTSKNSEDDGVDVEDDDDRGNDDDGDNKDDEDSDISGITGVFSFILRHRLPCKSDSSVSFSLTRSILGNKAEELLCHTFDYSDLSAV